MPGFRTAVLGLLSALMLVLYAWLVTKLAMGAHQCVGVTQASACTFEVTQRFALALNPVQSLVSALVISVLAISKPGQKLNLRFLGETAGWVDSLAMAYVVVWIVAGATAFVYGQFILPDVHVERFALLVNVGSAWFGLAIAAAYAYLGIQP